MHKKHCVISLSGLVLDHIAKEIFEAFDAEYGYPADFYETDFMEEGYLPTGAIAFRVPTRITTILQKHAISYEWSWASCEHSGCSIHIYCAQSRKTYDLPTIEFQLALTFEDAKNPEYLDQVNEAQKVRDRISQNPISYAASSHEYVNYAVANNIADQKDFQIAQHT